MNFNSLIALYIYKYLRCKRYDILCDICKIMYGNGSRAECFSCTIKLMRELHFLGITSLRTPMVSIKGQLNGNRLETGNFANFFYKHSFVCR